MDYEARMTLKDGTVVRSYHATPRGARDWFYKVSAGIKANENAAEARNETRERAEPAPSGR